MTNRHSSLPLRKTNPLEEGLMTGNRRIDRLLLLAEELGYEVAQSSSVKDCWTIKPAADSEFSLTLYGELNHSCTVMADIPGTGRWMPITQKRAVEVLKNKELELGTD